MSQNRLVRLLTIHVVALLVLLLLILFEGSAPWLNELSFTITASQLSLLSIWMGLGKWSPARRWLIGMTIAPMLVLVRTLALSQLAATIGNQNLLAEIAFHRLGRLVIVGCFLWLLARPLFCIRRCVRETNSVGSLPVQFGLRHLMVTILGVAVAVAVGKEIYEFVGRSGDAIRQESAPFMLYQLAFLAVGVLYGLLIILLSLWSCLGSKRPQMSVPLALLMCCLFSPIWPFLSHQPPDAFATQMLVTFAQALVVMASLLVLRWDGYRLLLYTGSVGAEDGWQGEDLSENGPAAGRGE